MKLWKKNMIKKVLKKVKEIEAHIAYNVFYHDNNRMDGKKMNR